MGAMYEFVKTQLFSVILNHFETANHTRMHPSCVVLTHKQLKKSFKASDRV